ncbi:MAG: glutathione S-transferase family protein [Kofleriaceae bacterium]
MTKPRLTYFDAAVSRGEECRLALHLAGVEFTDSRLHGAAWAELKLTTPFGSLPTLEFPGKPVLAQSNAILVYVGREHGLHPSDAFEAARHEALMAFAEELRHHVSPVLRIKDEPDRTAKRTELATIYLPNWARFAERQLGDGPFVAGEKLHVVDVKLYMVMRWFISGTVDHVPTTVFEPFPKLLRLFHAVADHPGVKAWQARGA